MDEPFVDRWNRKWSACGYQDVDTEMISCGSDTLPDSAAPFLNFNRADRPTPIWEVFGTPSQWSLVEQDRLSRYRVIGTDGTGNPICIEQGTDAVVLLDHEDRFRTRQFVNSSVRQLAECLLAYMGERNPERFRSAVQTIDSAALAECTFWTHEAIGIDT